MRLTASMLLPGLSGAEIAGLLLGHAIFGLTVGAIYTRPVGYPADRPPKVRPAASAPVAQRSVAAAADSGLHLRHRHRVQLSDHRGRPLAAR